MGKPISDGIAEPHSLREVGVSADAADEAADVARGNDVREIAELKPSCRCGGCWQEMAGWDGAEVRRWARSVDAAMCSCSLRAEVNQGLFHIRLRIQA